MLNTQGKPDYAKNPTLVSIITEDHPADWLMEAAQKTLFDIVLAQGGMREFESDRRTAAIHEAGHAIIVKSLGATVTRCCIYLETYRDLKGQWREDWSGEVHYEMDYPLNNGPIEIDIILDKATFVIAGMLSEMTYLKEDFRCGSAIDEVVTFANLIGRAARMLKMPPHELALNVINNVSAILTKHSDIHARIAGRLMNIKALRRREMEKLLRAVGSCKV